MLSSINFYFEIYKIYRNFGLTKKQVWIRLKKLGFSKDLIFNLDNMYKLELIMKNGGLVK